VDAHPISGISGKIPEVKQAFELHYEAVFEKPSGTGELFCGKVSDLVTGRWTVTIKVFQTDSVTIQGVPGKLPDADFNKTSKCLGNLVQECAWGHDPRSLRLTRAKSIGGLLQGQSGKDEVERVVMVLLSETIIELLLNERLNWNKILDSDLKKAGVPQKLKALEGRFGKVYKYGDMGSLWEMRCSVAHEGKGVNETDAKWAQALALDLLDKTR
jgi:hypothetical protein